MKVKLRTRGIAVRFLDWILYDAGPYSKPVGTLIFVFLFNVVLCVMYMLLSLLFHGHARIW